MAGAGQLERALRINDDVMRHLVLRYDAKMERHYTQTKADSASARTAALPAARHLRLASRADAARRRAQGEVNTAKHVQTPKD